MVEKTESFARNFHREDEITCIFANNDLQNISVFAYDTVDSTNTRAKLFAKSCVAGISPAIFISRAQSAGRGTRARTFESPDGAGLYMSLLFPENMLNSDPIYLTSYAALTVSRAISLLSDGKIEPKIKWVNDIVIADKKLAGILTEASLSDSGEKFFIVGIGINLMTANHSNEVLGLMTSLSEHGVEIDTYELAASITRAFFSSLGEFGSPKITEEYKSLSSLISRRVCITGTDCGCVGTAIDIDENRAIVIKLDDGSIKKYFSGDASIRPTGD